MSNVTSNFKCIISGRWLSFIKREMVVEISMSSVYDNEGKIFILLTPGCRNRLNKFHCFVQSLFLKVFRRYSETYTT